MNKIATLSLLPLALTAACGQVVSTPKPLTEKQSAVLTKELNGKIAGKPVIGNTLARDARATPFAWWTVTLA